MTLVKITVSIILVVALTLLTGCTSASTSFDTTRNDEGQIGVGDLLEVSVYRVSELDRTVRVDQDGMISMILIGQVNAIGKTERELEYELERLYEIDYLQDPEISVFVKERAANQHGRASLPG